ncbi:MAG: hypothetical protein AB7I24_09225 [Candidatus Nanopelagicales bacterium]
MGDRDGRLELDELGGVIDTAERLDAVPAPDLLEGGEDHPTWGERARGSRAFAWAAAHRGWMTAGAVAAVAAVVVPAVVVANRPPDPDPTIDVSVMSLTDEANGNPGVTGYGGGLFGSVYQVTSLEEGWSGLRIDGISGPGIRTSRSEQVPSPTSDLPRFRVAAAAGCDSPAYDGFFRGDYVLHLSATEAYGRPATATVDAPLPAYGGWSETVGQWCWEKVPASLGIDVQSVRGDRALAEIEVAVEVANPNPFSLWVSNAYADSAWLAQSPADVPRPVEARSTAVLPIRLAVTDCRAGDDGVWVEVLQGDASTVRRPGIGSYITTSEQRFGAQLPVLFEPGAVAELDAARRTVCRGVPAIGLQSLDAVPATAPDPATGLYPLALRIRLGSVTGTDRLTADVVDDTLGWRGTTPTTTEVVADGSVQDVVWDVDCGYVPSPPVLRLRSESGAPRPQLLDLGIEPLRSALVQTCPGFLDGDLVTMGWGSAADAASG